MTEVESSPAFSGEGLHSVFSSKMQAKSLKMGQVMPLLRMALSGIYEWSACV